MGSVRLILQIWQVVRAFSARGTWWGGYLGRRSLHELAPGWYRSALQAAKAMWHGGVVGEKRQPPSRRSGALARREGGGLDALQDAGANAGRPASAERVEECGGNRENDRGAALRLQGGVLRLNVATDKQALSTSHSFGMLGNSACARVFREARKTAPGAGALPGLVARACPRLV